MKFDQGFVTWSPKSLSQGETNGQGTVASSTPNQRFNQNLLAVESLFVRENSAEPVPFTMYARSFEKFVSLGISPGKNYPGITTQNLLVHIFVPQTQKSWEAFAGCMTELPFYNSLDDQDYMRTDLPVFEAGEDYPALFDLASILYEFGFNEDKERLAYFLQRSVGIILEQSGSLLIALKDGNTGDMRSSAGRITWLIAMAMPKPDSNTMRYIRNISYGVGTKENASKATVIYADRSAVDELNAKHVFYMDSYMAEKEEEEILPVFRAVSDKIIEYSRKNENFYQLISELEGGRDPIWGDLQLISDARYCHSNSLTVSTLNMGYIYWKLEDPARRGRVRYADIKTYYSGLLVQTKLGNKWHETMLFNYLRQEDSPDYQSVLSFWQEVLSPALRRRDQFDKEAWNEYLDFVFWCMKHVYDTSPKNHRVFLHQLKNYEDSKRVQYKLYNDDSDDNIIEQELRSIHSADDYQRFIDDYFVLCQEISELKQRALVPVAYQVYIKPDTGLERRIKISKEDIPGLNKKVEDYIKNYFTAGDISSFIKNENELKRTEDRYLKYAYYCLYNCLEGYIGQTAEFLTTLKYQAPFSGELRIRNIQYDPGISHLLEKEYIRNLDLKTVEDLSLFPDENWIEHLEMNGIDYYTLWQNRIFEALDGNSLTSVQIQSICKACRENGLFSRLPDLKTYKKLFHILHQSTGTCITAPNSLENKTEAVALRISIQIALMDVCEQRKWRLRIQDNDDDVWDWKSASDFSDFYSAWRTLSRNDKYRIMRFPEPQSFRHRISNQNLVRVYDYADNYKSIIEELENEKLEDRYYYNNYKNRKTRLLYLDDKACKTLLEWARELFQKKSSEINADINLYRSILMNFNWILSLFDEDVYWDSNEVYKRLAPDDRRIYFYESGLPIKDFVLLYKKCYPNPENGTLYLRQVWRFSKMHEDYDRYLKNKDQIIDNILDGKYYVEWGNIIRSLKHNINAGREDHMENAEIYKENKSALSDIHEALDVYQKSLRELHNNVCDETMDYNSCAKKFNNAQQLLNQIEISLELKQKRLEENMNTLESKKSATEQYAGAFGETILDGFKHVPIDGNMGGYNSERYTVTYDDYNNEVRTYISTDSVETSQQKSPKGKFSDEAKKSGDRL